MGLAECTEETTVSNVKVEEMGKKAVFLNPDNSLHRKIRIDGCLVLQGERADWAEKDQVGVVIVELKGRDVEKAADQVLASATYWRDQLKQTLPMSGLIVGSQYPRASASMQKKQASFARAFKGPLRVINKEARLRLEEALAFK